VLESIKVDTKGQRQLRNLNLDLIPFFEKIESAFVSAVPNTPSETSDYPKLFGRTKSGRTFTPDLFGT
jgi:hypothetical protein